MRKITSFEQGGKLHDVTFKETTKVARGVVCDVYKFDMDKSRDLALVLVNRGCKTPLQKVLKGNSTIEGFLIGKGKLTVKDKKGKTRKHVFGPGDKGEIEVKVGQTVQWVADKEDNLVFYEICDPPYEEGRFEDLEE